MEVYNDYYVKCRTYLVNGHSSNLRRLMVGVGAVVRIAVFPHWYPVVYWNGCLCCYHRRLLPSHSSNDALRFRTTSLLARHSIPASLCLFDG